MSKTKRIVINWLIPIIASVLLGFGIAKIFVLEKVGPEYNQATSNFVFTVETQFNNYYWAVNSLFDLKYELEKKNLTEAERVTLNKKLLEIKRNIQKTNLALEQKLKETIKHYGDSVKPSIDAFINWENSVDVYQISHQDSHTWAAKYSELQNDIYHHLRKASNYYNISNQRDAHIMQLLPEAEAKLKNNPNDPDLCTVMKDFATHSSPEKVAQRMAFIRLGSQYCDKYYHKRSAWGAKPFDAKAIQNAKNKYDKLPYAVYYEQYVLPEVPKALEMFKNRNDNADICDRRGVWTGDRNPEKDALRVAYRSEGKQYCPTLSELEQKNYLSTDYFCMVFINQICNEEGGCDVFERCKPNNGILFND